MGCGCSFLAQGNKRMQAPAGRATPPTADEAACVAANIKLRGCGADKACAQDVVNDVAQTVPGCALQARPSGLPSGATGAAAMMCDTYPSYQCKFKQYH